MTTKGDQIESIESNTADRTQRDKAIEKRVLKSIEKNKAIFDALND
jgi:hypothetical protein